MLIGNFFGSTAACQHHGRTLLEMKRSRICHHIAARSGSNAAELNQKPGLKSWLISAAAAIQMRQRMRVSSSFSECKRCGEGSAHSQFSSDFRAYGASKQLRAPQLNCIKPSQEYSKKETAECVFCSRRTHFATRAGHIPPFFSVIKGPINKLFR